MNLKVTLPTTDMALYMTDIFDDKVSDFYTQAYQDVDQNFMYSEDREIYNPEQIENTPADWFVITTINDEPVQGYLCSNYDWMPADWFRHYTRLFNLKSYTDNPNWMKYRMTEAYLLKEADKVFQRKNWIVTQNVTTEGHINFDNWKKILRRNKRIIDKGSPFTGYSYPSIVYVNKTPQMVVYSTFKDEEPDISWLEEFAVDEN